MILYVFVASNICPGGDSKNKLSSARNNAKGKGFIKFQFTVV